MPLRYGTILDYTILYYKVLHWRLQGACSMSGAQAGNPYFANAPTSVRSKIAALRPSQET